MNIYGILAIITSILTLLFIIRNIFGKKYNVIQVGTRTEKKLITKELYWIEFNNNVGRTLDDRFEFADAYYVSDYTKNVEYRSIDDNPNNDVRLYHQNSIDIENPYPCHLKSINNIVYKNIKIISYKLLETTNEEKEYELPVYKLQEY